eukprot:CAMPEP_0174739504 /NCGR_PEP_ID=MMETSP1094-20130205/71716_1 /TAXON_ID=156173 /ORGANISM="Chrysochromulina brevifilum, Strain UTEX LB 985" /LENGTH=56 /DNA_ID=CAMNT_0015943075 /DNA_START=136 /DNA_END=302 /DNA_ORIENTATION=-
MGQLLPYTTLPPMMGALYSFLLARHSEKIGIRRMGLASSFLFPLGLYLMPAYAVST